MNVYERFAAYPFDTDKAFQDGLSDILKDVNESVNREELLLKAKVFYFSTITGQQISWEDVNSSTLTETMPHSQTDKGDINQMPEGNAAKNEQPIEGNLGSVNLADMHAKARELTFAEITALIESNQTHLIPNNEIIPGGINEREPSQAKEKPRKKPWEKD